MKEMNFYKNQIKRAVQEGFIDHDKGEQGVLDTAKGLIKEDTKYDKLVTVISLFAEILPDSVFRKIKSVISYKDFSNLPFDPDKYKFIEKKIGSGVVSNVHLLESKKQDGKSYVVKLDYSNSGSLDDLIQKAKEQHEEFKNIKENYSKLPDLVPNEVSLITTDNKKNTPVIATVQEYVGNNLLDIFVDFNKYDLLLLLKEHPELKKEFKTFIDISLDLLTNKNETIDLIGYQNLSVVDEEGEKHLRFIDPHNICYTESDPNKDGVSEMKRRLTYLREIGDVL